MVALLFTSASSGITESFGKWIKIDLQLSDLQNDLLIVLNGGSFQALGPLLNLLVKSVFDSKSLRSQLHKDGLGEKPTQEFDYSLRTNFALQFADKSADNYCIAVDSCENLA